MMPKKLLIICGPTASGKTSLGLYLAKKFKGEIISADSRQVYKGMDIGTGKDLETIFRSKIPVYLLDVVRPDEKFNAANFHQLAWKAIGNICQKKKLPILVGGTGFYIKTLVDGIGSLGIEPDWKLRKKLENLRIEELVEKLGAVDHERLAKMNQSDQKNPRRLIRAIEIGLAKKDLPLFSPLLADVLMIGLTAPKKLLYKRIDERVKTRVRLGAKKEIEKLLREGYNWENSVLGETLGYQQWQPFFKGKISEEEAIARWQFAEHAYARRQLTWFKKDKRIKWFDFTKPGFDLRVEKRVKDWYTKVDAAKS